MKGKKCIGLHIIKKVMVCGLIILISTSSIFASTTVPVTGTVDAWIKGNPDIYAYQPGHTGITGSTGTFVTWMTNVSSHLARVNQYTYGINTNSANIYSRLGSIYENCLVPMSTTVNYYMPNIDTKLATIGSTTDTIRTDVSLSKGILQNIYNTLNSAPYMDVTVDNNDKTDVSDSISQFVSLIPRDSGHLYYLNIDQLLTTWGSGDVRLDIIADSTEYTDLYD